MEKQKGVRPGQGRGGKTESKETQAPRGRKLSEYGQQLVEKQRVKHMYGMRERQFKRFYAIADRSQQATGDALLNLLERRLDNVIYRLKFATSREQGRQIIVHGHILVDGVKVTAPSYLVAVGEEIALSPRSCARTAFMEFVVAKRMKKAVKPPEWLELDKDGVRGRILREPVRSDLRIAIEDHRIIELYSK